MLMKVSFYDERGNVVSTEFIEGDHYDDVCRNAWSAILSGRIKADDFQVLED